MDDMSAKSKKATEGVKALGHATEEAGEKHEKIRKLTAELDNVNARLHIQERRLGEYKRQYDATFNDDRKLQLQDKIIALESSMLRLSERSDKLSAEIWELDDSLEDAAGAADDFSDKINDTVPPAERAASSYTKITVAAAAVGAAYLAVAKKAVEAAATFESSMARVQAMSGATTAEFRELEKQAISLGAATVFSSSEVAEGQAYLAIAGYKANDIIAAMPGLLNLAAAAQMDLGAAADITSNILTGFRLEADQTGRVSDVLTKAFTSSNTSMEQLGYAMRYSAPIAASLGMSIEETAAAIGILSNAGIQGEMAGTQLRAMLLRLIKPVGDAKSVMEELGIVTSDASGNILPFSDILGQVQTAFGKLTESAQAEAAAMIAGTEATSGFLTLVNTGASELERFTGELENSGGTAQQIADIQMDTLNGALEELRSAMEAAGIAVGNEFIPMLRGVAEEITKVALGFSEMDIGLRTFIITSTSSVVGAIALAAAIGGITKGLKALAVAARAAHLSLGWITVIGAVLGVAVGAFMAYKASAEEAAEQTRELNEVLDKNPFSRSISDIGVLTDRIKALNDPLEKIKNAMQELSYWESVAQKGEGTPEINDRMMDLGKSIREAHKELKELGFTAEEIEAEIADLNSEIEKSIPALLEMTRAEDAELAVKAAKIGQMTALRDRYAELTAATDKNAESTDELDSIVRQITAEYPQLNRYIDDQYRLMDEGITVLDDVLAAEERNFNRISAIAKERLQQQRDALDLERSLLSIQTEKYSAMEKTYQDMPYSSHIVSYAQHELDQLQSEADKLTLQIAEIDKRLAGMVPSAPTADNRKGLETGKEKDKGKEKTVEQIATDAYRASLQLLEKRRLLGQLTEEAEEEALAGLAEKYKKYDSIWIDAENRRQRLLSQMAAAAEKDAKERAKQAEDEQRASYERSAYWIEMETRRMTERGESERAITEMQLEAWSRVRSRYEKDSEYFRAADKATYDALMSLRKLDEKAAREAADTIERTQKDVTKSFLAELERQRKAELSALDQRKATIQKHYDDLLRIIDESERGRERKAIEAEAEKYRHATSEKGRKRYADLQEQLRKMDVEDNRQALQQERDDKLTALDDQRRDVESWYSDIKSAAEDFNGDMTAIYQLTEDARLAAFVDTNEAIKAEMRQLQRDLSDIVTQSESLASVTSPHRTSVIRRMQANSAAWQNEDAAGKARLHAENQQLAAEIGATFDNLTGKWLGADRIPIYHTGGIVGSRTFSAGDMLMPDEVTAILREGETVLTPEQVRSIFKAGNGRASVTIEKLVGVEMNDTTLEDEIDVRAIGRTGVDMAAELARRQYTGGV